MQELRGFPNPDLLNAIWALSQLSYSPLRNVAYTDRCRICQPLLSKIVFIPEVSFP